MLPETFSQHTQNQNSPTQPQLGCLEPGSPSLFPRVLCVVLRRLWEPPSCKDRAPGWLGNAGGSPSVPSALSLTVLLVAKLQVSEFIHALGSSSELAAWLSIGCAIPDMLLMLSSGLCPSSHGLALERGGVHRVALSSALSCRSNPT